MNKEKIESKKFYNEVLDQITHIEDTVYWEKFDTFYAKLSELADAKNMDIEVVEDDEDCVINLNFTDQENGNFFRSCFAISRAEFNTFYKKYSIDNFANRYFNSLLQGLTKLN
jgi:hypothetical protein